MAISSSASASASASGAASSAARTSSTATPAATSAVAVIIEPATLWTTTTPPAASTSTTSASTTQQQAHASHSQQTNSLTNARISNDPSQPHIVSDSVSPTPQDIPAHTAASRLTLSSVDASIPSPVLSRLSASAGVPPEYLSTVVVHPSTPTLYNALSEYAALFAEWRDYHTPLSISCLDFPLLAPDSDSEYSLDYSSDASLSSSDSDSEVELDNQDADALPDDSLLSRVHRAVTKCITEVPTPAFTIGKGESALLWPPPIALSAKYLAYQELKLKHQNLPPPLQTPSAPTHPTQPNPSDILPSHTHIYADMSATTASSAPSAPSAPSVPSASAPSPSNVPLSDAHQSYNVFFVAHYDVGKPVGLRDSALQVSKLLVATAEPASVLRQFLTELLQWNVCRHVIPIPPPRKKLRAFLALSRFKLRENGDSFWESEAVRRSRSPRSVILPDGMMSAILSDVRAFLSSSTKSWYRDHGLPQRRALLFYGPPGTGKTSTIKVVASQFGRVCCFLSMAGDKFSNQALADALESLPPRPMLVIEDVDALFTNRKSSRSSLTFSGLLNALDGVLSVDGVLTIMTTNHIDRLDEALLRAGRIDRRFYFGLPDDDCVKRIFLSFYPQALESVGERFAMKVKERPEEQKARSMATLQQLFIMMREKSAEECVEGVEEFFDTYFPRGVDVRRAVLERAMEEEEEKRKEVVEAEENGSKSDGDGVDEDGKSGAASGAEDSE